MAQTDMQLVASSTFVQILQRDLVPVQNYSQTFLQTILSSVDNKDPGGHNGPFLFSCFNMIPNIEVPLTDCIKLYITARS